MALTPSNMLPLGTIAPDFQLFVVKSEKLKTLQELKSPKGTVIMFICNHCPFVKYIQEQLVKVAKDYSAKGISFVAINSNDAENYPEDSPANMKKIAEEKNYSFPYLFDETQTTAKAYQAACTPDFYLFDENLRCVYRGQFDDARPGNDLPITGNSLTQAMDSLLMGKVIDVYQKPSIGCNIKWKA